jgi:predicted P-loop ATPase
MSAATIEAPAVESAIVVPGDLDIGRGNAPKPSHANVLRVLESFGDRIRLETFSGRVVVAGVPEAVGHLPDGEWSDTHTTELAAALQRFELDVSRDTVAHAVEAHARRREYNVLTDWLVAAGNKWDREPRVDTAMARYWGAPDDAASRAVSRVFLLSLAARGLKPGCKVDTAPVLIGEQGQYKSSSLAALVGKAWFSDSPIPIGEKDAMQLIRGVWLWEVAENVGLSRKDRNAVKAFLSSSEDVYRASYGRYAERVPRQTTFAVSTNDRETLTDPTGARRFLPVEVGRIDVEGIARDREQLLGEAAWRVGAEEERWWPDADDDAALAEAREAATETDPWEQPIAEWFARREQAPEGAAGFARGAGPPTLEDVATGALSIAARDLDKPRQGRLSSCLRRLGYERSRVWGRGPDRGKWVWARQT